MKKKSLCGIGRNIRWLRIVRPFRNLHLTQHISKMITSKLFSYSPIFVADGKFSRCYHRSQMICSSAKKFSSVTWNRNNHINHFGSFTFSHWNLDGFYYLLRTVSGIVKRQTPFRNSTKCLLVPLRIGVSLRYHSMYGCGSHWTMHSKRAVCPLITAISFNG